MKRSRKCLAYIEKFEATGSPVITDGEQTKPSFATYPIHTLSNLRSDGVKIQFADGHVRQLPKLSSGPFRYKTYASTYLEAAKKIARMPVKQAVISPSALGLLYPSEELAGYPQEKFVEDERPKTFADVCNTERIASRSTSPKVGSQSSWIQADNCSPLLSH